MILMALSHCHFTDFLQTVFEVHLATPAPATTSTLPGLKILDKVAAVCTLDMFSYTFFFCSGMFLNRMYQILDGKELLLMMFL